MNVELSVIIPTYNRPKKLKRCLLSIVSQSLPTHLFEVIVVNDGSKQDILPSALPASSGVNIKILKQHNQGPAAARNTGIKASQGKILVFIDDDCTANDDWLSKIYQAFEHHLGISIIQGPYKYLPSLNPFYRASDIISQIADRVRIIPSLQNGHQNALYIGTGNLALRKSFIVQNSLYFDEKLSPREDEDFYRQIAQQNLQVLYLQNPVMHECCCGPIVDYRRYYAYGKGEFYLRKKWGNKLRLRYDISLKNIIRTAGMGWGLCVWLIIKYRSWASRKGLQQKPLI